MVKVASVVPTLPRYISIKADNGKYLTLNPDGLLIFDATERSNLTTHEALYDGDGAILIRSAANRRFWKRDYSNSSYIQATANNVDAAGRFKVSKLDSGKLVFESAKDNLYLKRYLMGKTNGYAAVARDPDVFAEVTVSDASEYAVYLPEYICIKGDNGKYLHAHYERDVYWLKFHGANPADDWGTNQVISLLDGSVALYNVQSRSFWRNSTNWIWADVSKQEDADGNTRCHFEPIKLGSNMIALKNTYNGLFCKRFTDYWENCLNAGAGSYNDSAARLIISDATMKRSIFNVNYLLKLATTSDAKPQMVGRGSLTNHSSHTADMKVVVTIQNKVSKSHMWSNSFTFSEKISMNIKCGVPYVADAGAGVEIGATQTFGNQWGETVEEVVQFQTEYLIKNIGPGQTAQVTLKCTTAKMRIPFNYKCRDTALSGYDRPVVDYIDGIYEGVAVYDTTAEINNGSTKKTANLKPAKEGRAWTMV